MASRVIVEWTRTTLRLALADGSGSRSRLRAIDAQPITAPGDLGRVLRGMLETHRVSPRHVISVIPREQVITRVVKFPTTQPAELAQMVELYAKAQLPYPREQAVFDFHVVSQHEGFSTVAIVACQRDVVDRQLAVLREAGITTVFLTVSSWGVLGWFRRLAVASSANEPSLVVNVDDNRADLVLVGEGRILSSRSVGQGVHDWEALGETGELLALEIERSRAAIRKELPGTEVLSFILTGLGPLSQWSEQIARRLGVSVKAIDGRQPFTEWAAPLVSPISPVVVGGLACTDTRALLNLSPAEMRVHVRHRQQVKELVMVSALLLAVLTLGSGLLTLEISRQRQMAIQLGRILVQVEPSAKQIREKTRSAQLVGSVLDERRRLATTLAGVFRITPASIALEALNFERPRDELTLRGSAGSTQEVLEYIKQLEALEGITGVQLKYSTRRSTPTGERTDFELVFLQRGQPS